MDDYKWYALLGMDVGLQQGDIIEECPIISPPASIKMDESYSVDIRLLDVIVLSQSCD